MKDKISFDVTVERLSDGRIRFGLDVRSLEEWAELADQRAHGYDLRLSNQVLAAQRVLQWAQQKAFTQRTVNPPPKYHQHGDKEEFVIQYKHSPQLYAVVAVWMPRKDGLGRPWYVKVGNQDPVYVSEERLEGLRHLESGPWS